MFKLQIHVKGEANKMCQLGAGCQKRKERNLTCATGRLNLSFTTVRRLQRSRIGREIRTSVLDILDVCETCE